jgi:hypothetical protein
MELRLQDRLQEESPVMKAAEGLSPEQRNFIREREITAEIDKLTKEREDLRNGLIEHYKETGDSVSNGAYKLAPYTVQSHAYDEEALMARFPDYYPKWQKLDSTKIAAMEKAGLLEGIEDCRTTSESWRFHAAKEK